MSEACNTLSAILAGSVFATDIMFAVLVDVADRIETIGPPVRLSMVVDDLTVHTIGDEREVADNLCLLLDEAVELMPSVGMMVSLGAAWAPGGRTVAVVSTERLEELLKGASP